MNAVPPSGGPESTRSDRGRALGLAAVGALAAALVLAFQSLTVAYFHAGDWSALFMDGTAHSVPDELAWERHRRMDGTGYDGRLYHLMAHDPLLRRGLVRYVDAPRLRYRRILVPLAAHLIALGLDAWVDVAYRAVLLAFVFAGTWWCGRYAAERGRSPAWGLGFLLVPAVPVSAERMTVDVALAALTAGFAVYVSRRPTWRLTTVLALAALARETGVLLALGAALAAGLAGRRRHACSALAALGPALLWFAYVHARTPSYDYANDPRPLAGVVRALVEPDPAPDVRPGQVGEWWRQTIRRKPAFDRVALAGMVLAMGMGLWGLRPWPPDAHAMAAALFALLAVFTQRLENWMFVYDYARHYSPLLLLLLMGGLRDRRVLPAVPLLLMWPRILVELAMPAVAVLRALLQGRRA